MRDHYRIHHLPKVQQMIRRRTLGHTRRAPQTQTDIRIGRLRIRSNRSQVFSPQIVEGFYRDILSYWKDGALRVDYDDQNDIVLPESPDLLPHRAAAQKQPVTPEAPAEEKVVVTKVGVMNVKIAAGPDGELGTPDDEVTLTPENAAPAPVPEVIPEAIPEPSADTTVGLGAIPDDPEPVLPVESAGSDIPSLSLSAINEATKPALIKMCQEAYLPTDGSKADLKQRLLACYGYAVE